MVIKRTLFRTSRGQAVAVAESPEQRQSRRAAAADEASRNFRMTEGQRRALNRGRRNRG